MFNLIQHSMVDRTDSFRDHETNEARSRPFDPAGIIYPPTTGVRKLFETSLVLATEEPLKGYGHLVTDPEQQPIEITR